MRIMHVSDTHGYFPELEGEFDAVVHSGDFHAFNKRESYEGRQVELDPNRTPKKRKAEIEFQKEWLFDKIPTIKDWIKGKPFLFCSGNHDFFNPCAMLNDNGIEAIDLDNKVVEYMGYVWYGFPYVPMIRNSWNFEREPTDLKREVQTFVARLKNHGKLDGLDILVAHCPMSGILDKAKRSIGNKHMNSAVSYQLQKLPKAYLCGHVHPDNGLESMGEMIVSNAAVGDSGKPRIIYISSS